METQQPVQNQTPLPESITKVATVQSGGAGSRDNVIIISVIILLVLISCGLGIYLFTFKPTQKTAQTVTISPTVTEEEPEPTTVITPVNETSTQQISNIAIEDTTSDFDYLASDLKDLE